MSLMFYCLHQGCVQGGGWGGVTPPECSFPSWSQRVKVGHGWSKPPILRRRFWSKHQFYAADMVIIGQKNTFRLNIS